MQGVNINPAFMVQTIPNRRKPAFYFRAISHFRFPSAVSWLTKVICTRSKGIKIAPLIQTDRLPRTPAVTDIGPLKQRKDPSEDHLGTGAGSHQTVQSVTPGSLRSIVAQRFVWPATDARSRGFVGKMKSLMLPRQNPPWCKQRLRCLCRRKSKRCGDRVWVSGKSCG